MRQASKQPCLRHISIDQQVNFIINLFLETTAENIPAPATLTKASFENPAPTTYMVLPIIIRY
ncbi:hypothetical protein GCM10027291_11540 [Telluribacter humicola]